LNNRIESLKELAQSLIAEIESLRQAKPMDFSRGIDFQEEIRMYESALIREALRLTRGNQRKAASLLGLRHTTLNSKIKRYNIS
jgi:DNA-binding NtrC family response regulator